MHRSPVFLGLRITKQTLLLGLSMVGVGVLVALALISWLAQVR